MFYTRLSNLRRTYNLSSSELARVLGISKLQYEDYENNEAIPSMTECIAIADYFSVSLDYLVGRYDFCNPSLIRTTTNRILLSDCMDNWFVNHQNSGIAPQTIDSYIKPVNDCKDYFKKQYIDDITPKAIDGFIHSLVEKGYKRQTINLRYIALKKTYDYAIHERLINSNPVTATSLPRGLTSTSRHRLTCQQVAKIKASQNLYANMLLYTGTRRNECLAIKYEDIDFDNNLIHIQHQVLWLTGKQPTLTKPKTSCSNAKIPLLQPLKILLAPYRAHKGLIFHQTDGSPLTQGQFTAMWNNFKKQIEENITPHQLRHEYISQLHDAGIDTKTAQVLARHANYSTTMDIYTELDDKVTSSAVAQINQYLTQETNADYLSDRNQKMCT